MNARWRTLGALAGATGVSQAAVFVASPVLTRLYSPADFGAYAAAVSVVSIAIVVACLRFEQAILLPGDDRMVASLVVLCLGLASVTSVLLGVMFLLLQDQIAERLGSPSVSALLLPVLLAVFGGALYATASAWAVRVGAFSDLARTRVTQAVSLLILQIGFGLARIGAPGLVLGDAAGRSAGTARLAQLMWHAQQDAFRGVTAVSVRTVARRYRRFALLSTPSALLDIVAVQVPVFILLMMFGAPVAGLYALASRVGTVPNALAAASIGPLFLEESARLQRHDPALLQASFMDSLRRLALLGIGPTILLAVTSPVAFPVIFGPTWSDAGLYAAILAPMLYAQLVTSPLSSVLGVLERQDLHLAREVLSIAVLGVAVGVAIAADLEPVQVVAVLSAAGTLNGTIYLGVMWLAISRAAPAAPRVASR